MDVDDADDDQWFEGPTDELTNRAIGRYFHLCWEVWVIVANSAAFAVSLTSLIKTSRARQTHLTVFAMTICDLTTGVVTLSFHIVSGGDFGRLTRLQCTVNAAFLVFLALQSMMLVLVLGVVRYRILAQKPLSMKVVKLMLVALWGACLSYALFVAHVPGLVAPSISRYYCFHRYGRFNAVTTFVTLVAAVFGATPALVLLVCYIRLFLQMRVIEAAAKTKKYSRTVAYMGFTIVLVYSVSIVPWSIQCLYRLFAAPEAEVPADIDGVFSIMIHANFGINPILYFLFKRDYRRVVRRWFGCHTSNASTKTFGSSCDSVNSQTWTATSHAVDCAAGRPSRASLSRASTRGGLLRLRTEPEATVVDAGSPPTSITLTQLNFEGTDFALKRRISRLSTLNAERFESLSRASTRGGASRLHNERETVKVEPASLSPLTTLTTPQFNFEPAHPTSKRRILRLNADKFESLSRASTRGSGGVPRLHAEATTVDPSSSHTLATPQLNLEGANFASNRRSLSRASTRGAVPRLYTEREATKVEPGLLSTTSATATQLNIEGTDFAHKRRILRLSGEKFESLSRASTRGGVTRLHVETMKVEPGLLSPTSATATQLNIGGADFASKRCILRLPLTGVPTGGVPAKTPLTGVLTGGVPAPATNIELVSHGAAAHPSTSMTSHDKSAARFSLPLSSSATRAGFSSNSGAIGGVSSPSTNTVVNFHPFSAEGTALPFHPLQQQGQNVQRPRDLQLTYTRTSDSPSVHTHTDVSEHDTSSLPLPQPREE